jgi:hypothetical protein
VPRQLRQGIGHRVEIVKAPEHRFDDIQIGR